MSPIPTYGDKCNTEEYYESMRLKLIAKNIDMAEDSTLLN